MQRFPGWFFLLYTTKISSSNFFIFNGVGCIYQLPVFYPQGDPLEAYGDLLGPKTNYMPNLNSFLGSIFNDRTCIFWKPLLI